MGLIENMWKKKKGIKAEKGKMKRYSKKVKKMQELSGKGAVNGEEVAKNIKEIMEINILQMNLDTRKV